MPDLEGWQQPNLKNPHIMYFMIAAQERHDSIDFRLKTRDAHRKYLHIKHAQIQTDSRRKVK